MQSISNFVDKFVVVLLCLELTVTLYIVCGLVHLKNLIIS